MGFAKLALRRKLNKLISFYQLQTVPAICKIVLFQIETHKYHQGEMI